MKVYLSGAITYDKDYMQKFMKAEEMTKNLFENAGILNPAKTAATFPHEQMEYEDYMTICIAMLSTCDAIVMLESWRNSIGANRELEYAKKNGIDIYYIDQNIISKECKGVSNE